MKFVLLALLAGPGFPRAAQAVECADFGPWANAGCRRILDIYENGGNEFIVSGFAWHVPATWTRERRQQENEKAWGGGWARTVEQPNGDTETVYALVFSDSHRKPQFNLGYGWTTYWGERDSIQPGLGYTAFIAQRRDIASGVPIPGVLPLFALRYRKFTLLTTYIPKLSGGVNHGSVLYAVGKIALD